MEGKEDRPAIKNEEQYDALREKGMSKEKAARIANTDSEEVSQNNTPYEQTTYDELYDKAAEVGIDGRSDMSKDQLIEALREH